MIPLYESHCHTPLCKHAVGLPTEYALQAYRLGLAGITITCHNPMPNLFSASVRMSPLEWDEYQRLVAQATELWQGRIDVRLGLEADYFPGYEQWLDQQIHSAPLSYVLGSVHPQIREYRERFYSHDPIVQQSTYFRLLAEAAETGLFDCLSHPDLIKNIDPPQWQPERIMDVIAENLDRIARTGVAMELNTSGVLKKIPEMNPFPGMLAMMHQRGIAVVLGSDAHKPERVGEGFPKALDLLQGVGYTEVAYFVDRQRRRVAISELRDCFSQVSGSSPGAR